MKLATTIGNEDSLLNSNSCSKDTFYCAHSGISMNPTLSWQDLLEIRPYELESVQVGDVVLFQSREGHLVVHRVVELTKDGIRTQGDNNLRDDPGLLKSEDIIGRVVGACRGQRRRRIAGGATGRIDLFYIQRRNKACRAVASLLAPFYWHLVRWSDLWGLRRLCRPSVVKYGTSGKMVLFLGSMMVGDYDSLRGYWRIRPPFRLIIDEEAIKDAEGA